ncbi:MAG: SGNH/GDSL hydrolase family protein [Alphaproteobacteria bacterium]|nr:SGNH/GDSL hydrolase family protein [Alphaproteobacteria bacterium]MBU1525037.1 SGNH/GDSL hydrolase family protein [Alphaproteobacteria bacterium]MBU2292549.1 SGNH/GDSL hydrolase family protein [Alphaproteobacteria bacterium]MBU2381423.1 SGNH/GDSL hydrolase family protein [Alphaproteobacteria bacterium]
MKAAALALALLLPALPVAAQAVPAACPATADHLSANGGLDRTRAAVARGSVRILAVGSSSIEGVGASRRELGFVPLLEAGLRQRLPGVEVTVVNRGIGGETAKDTADRLAREVEAARPDLVIWQLGTNDVLRDRPMDDFFSDFRRGQPILEAAGVDVLLIDPQRLPEAAKNPAFAGRNPALAEVSRLIGLEGGRVGWAVHGRFAAMSAWGGLAGGGVGPDELHLNDEGYACWAAVTAHALAAALR